MSRHLPDVNVLFALIWPRHEGHSAAHSWFGGAGHRAWATNPLTQLGVVRLLTNPAITQGAVGPETALEAIVETTRHAGHEFWPLDQTIPDTLHPLAARIQGHQQWTDAVLLRHALARKGVFVTFDAGVKVLAERDASSHILVLKHR